MLTIACLSQKGGVGKSTLTRLLAVTYAQSDWRVKIADFNVKQKTSTDWAALRMSNGITPEIAAEPFSQVKMALKQAPHYDLMIFDGRPDSDVTSLEIARESDLILVPVGVSLDDLQPQVRFANELRAKNVEKQRIVFAINRSVESQVAIEDARDFVNQSGYECFRADVGMKTGYQIAQNSGRSIIETNFQTLNDRAAALATEVVGKLQVLTKKGAA